jgi:hypothetical protein
VEYRSCQQRLCHCILSHYAGRCVLGVQFVTPKDAFVHSSDKIEHIILSRTHTGR